MRGKGLIRILAVLIATMIATGMASASDNPSSGTKNASISLGAEFSSGQYGTGATTRSLYMPVIATWAPTAHYDLELELPFIYQSNGNVTTELFSNNQQAGTTATVAKRGPGGSASSGTVYLPGGAGGPGGAAGSGSSSGVSGLGDIIVRLRYTALPETDSLPQVRAKVFVKFPTADSDSGLGTGEFDAGAGIELTKWYADLHLLADGLYTYQGKAEGFGLKNYLAYSGGIGYRITENLEPMALVKGATAPSEYSSDLLEVRLRLIWDLSSTTTLDLYGSQGLTDSSPDYGGGIAVIHSF